MDDMIAAILAAGFELKALKEASVASHNGEMPKDFARLSTHDPKIAVRFATEDDPSVWWMEESDELEQENTEIGS